MRPIEFEGSRRPLPLAPAVWADWRKDRYYALARAELARRLRGADWLLLTGPHRFGPIGLASWLHRHGRSVGIRPVAHFGPADGTRWADVYALDHPRVDAIPTVVSTTVAEHLVAAHDFHPPRHTALAGTGGSFVRLRNAAPLTGIELVPSRLR